MHFDTRAVVVSAVVLVGCGPGVGADGSTGSGETTTGDTPTGGTGDTTGGTTGGTTGEAPTSSTGATTGDEPPEDDGSAFFVAARQGDQAFVLRVSPASGTAEPFGPALPVAADELRSPEVVAAPDGSLVTVRCYFEPEVPMATLLTGDGAGWQVVTKYNKFGLGQASMAADASLMWFDEVATPDAPTFQANVITPTGEVVFQGEPRTDTERLIPEAFGPGGAWFTYRDPERGLVLRTGAGEEAELPAEHTHLGFAASVVVSDFTDLQWVDLAAGPLVVPGFVAVADNVSSLGYQVADGALSRLGDGEVVPLQQVPADMQADEVFGHAAGAFAVGRVAPFQVWSTISAAGEVVAEFVPTPTTNVPDFGELDPRHYAVAACLDCATRTIVFHASNDVVDGDTSTSFDASIQLWGLGDQGETTAQSVLRPWTEVTESTWGPQGFHFSADGAFLVWTEEARLFRLELASAEVTMFAAEFEVVR